MDAGGREVGAATVTTPFTTTGGRVEMLVDALLACLHDVLAALGDGRRHVVAVGVAGIAESGAPLDSARRPLAPVIAWHDERGAEAVALLEREFGSDLALRNGQPPNTKMTAAKLGWLVAHGLHGMDRWLGVPELALRALAGAEATEHSLAARTGCYDVCRPPVDARSRRRPRVQHRRLRPGAGGRRRDGPGVGGGRRMVRADRRACRSPSPATTTLPGWRAPAPAPMTWPTRWVPPRQSPAGRPPPRTWPPRWPTGPPSRSTRAGPSGRSWSARRGPGRRSTPPPPNSAGRRRSSTPWRWPATPAPAASGRGVLDDLTARTVDAYARLTGVLGPRRRVVVFGGGSVSEPWLRAKAAALPVPVVRSTVTSAVARGAAVHAGVAAGWWPSEAGAVRPPASGR